MGKKNDRKLEGLTLKIKYTEKMSNILFDEKLLT